MRFTRTRAVLRAVFGTGLLAVAGSSVVGGWLLAPAVGDGTSRQGEQVELPRSQCHE